MTQSDFLTSCCQHKRDKCPKFKTFIYYIAELVCAEKEQSDRLAEQSKFFLYGPLRWTTCVTIGSLRNRMADVVGRQIVLG